MDSKRRHIALYNTTIEAIENFTSTAYNSDFTHKLNEAILTTSSMIKYTKREICRCFSKNELFVIIHSLEGAMYTPNISPKTFLIGVVEEGMCFKKLDIKFNVSKDEFLNKLNQLSIYQAYTMINMAFEYEYSKKTDEEFEEIFFINN